MAQQETVLTQAQADEAKELINAWLENHQEEQQHAA